MDKNLNRKILFDKKAAPSATEKPPKQEKKGDRANPQTPKQPEIKFQPDSGPNPALKPISWINNHPEFKWSAMCLKIGLDKSNFKRVLDAENPVLKADQVAKIENFLKDYGYAK